MGYDKVEWHAAPEASDRGQAVRLTYTSLDGEEVRAAAPPLFACARLHAALPRPAAPFPAERGCVLWAQRLFSAHRTLLPLLHSGSGHP